MFERFDIFLDLMNLVTDELFHELIQVSFQEYVDWDWLREKVHNLKNRGNNPCGILLNRTGVFSFEDKNGELGVSHLMNTGENEVIFHNASSLLPTSKVVSWDYLIKGEYSKTKI